MKLPKKKKEMNNMYEVTVEGEAIIAEGTQRELIGFKETFKLPNLDAALSVIQNKLINPRLKEKNPKALRFRTCGMVDVKEIVGDKAISKKNSKKLDEKNIDIMNRNELAEFVTLKGLPIDVVEFGDIMKARQAVKDALDNLALLKQKEERREKAKESDRALKELNDLPIDDLPPLE
jgi:hypothetical protein